MVGYFSCSRCSCRPDLERGEIRRWFALTVSSSSAIRSLSRSSNNLFEVSNYPERGEEEDYRFSSIVSRFEHIYCRHCSLNPFSEQGAIDINSPAALRVLT
jgi:hypothetical protein